MEDSGPVRKRRRGGVQQRQDRAAEENSAESALYILLMTQLAMGAISGALCHEIACAAMKDVESASKGLSLPSLKGLASSTSRATKLHAVIRDKMIAESNLPMPFKIQIPFSKEDVLAYILLPHEYFAAMFTQVVAWKKSVMPDAEQLSRLWSTLRRHPMMANHPVLKRSDYNTHCIPLAIHGDEVPVTGIGKVWSKSALVFSWFSIVANAAGGSFSSTLTYIWGIFEKFVVASTAERLGTMDVFWNIMRWSFNALYEGRWPTQDWRGMPRNSCNFMR